MVPAPRRDRRREAVVVTRDAPSTDVSTTADEPPGRGWTWLSVHPVTAQITAVLAAALVVQALLWFRGDSAAHVIGGAAFAMLLGAIVAPTGIRWVGAVTELAVFAAVAGAAWIGEQTLFGPFDLDDVAFTMGGAFVALAFLPRWAVASRPERIRVILAAVALAGVALAYRYLLGLGKA